eukprot:XP_025011996.1 uncharacterized protein LOC8284403 isoform X2 [Ricinus communis]
MMRMEPFGVILMRNCINHLIWIGNGRGDATNFILDDIQIGYRDGLLAGKEAIAQEGFNAGFKQSVLLGFDWGLVRGVTSAFACLPDGLKEKLIETPEKRNKFLALYESVHSLSTTDALKLFYDDIVSKKAAEQSEHATASSDTAGLQYKISDCILGNYGGELQSLLIESPAIDSHIRVD